jgi:hypothetical protein
MITMNLAHKMLSYNNGLVLLTEKRMRSFLINKNLCFYYWLKKTIRKVSALGLADTIEKTILILGREIIPYFNIKERLIKE